ncbi:unnamed protein product [Camellia sinensis]
MSAELKLSQSNRIFRPNEPLEGKIITKLPSSISHNGIRLTVNGSVTLQVRGGSAGVIESLYGVLKPIPIVLGLMFVGGLVLAYASEHLGIGSFLRGRMNWQVVEAAHEGAMGGHSASKSVEEPHHQSKELLTV